MISFRHSKRNIGDKCFSDLRNISREMIEIAVELFISKHFSFIFIITIHFVIADHKFDVPFTRRHKTNNCFQKMGIRLILMIVKWRIRNTSPSTKENKIRISMILPQMCIIFFRILRYDYTLNMLLYILDIL